MARPTCESMGAKSLKDQKSSWENQALTDAKAVSYKVPSRPRIVFPVQHTTPRKAGAKWCDSVRWGTEVPMQGR